MYRRGITILVLILLASMWLAACGGDEESTAPPPTATEVPTTAPEPTAEPTVEPTAEPETKAAEEAEGSVEEESADTEEAAAEEDASTEESATEDAESSAEEESAETEEAAAEEADTEETEETGDSVEASADEEAATPGAVSIESGRNVNDLLNEKSAAFSAVSPDGETIVYGISEGRLFRTTGFLCVYTFANADKVCYEAPEEYQGYPYSLVWSPDSRKVAFTENPLQLAYESDVWVFDVTDGTYTNRTDDGVYGSYISQEAGSYTLDYLPMWNQADGNLYFWRSVPTGVYGMVSLELWRLPGDGDAELVRDLSDELSGGLMWFDNEYYFMDGPSSISDDGTKIAMAMTSVQDAYNSPRTGLWVLDLTDESAEPQQLATAEDFQVALPQWEEVPALPQALQWTSDGNIVVLTLSRDMKLPLIVLYYSDIDSGELIPVVDFSSSTTRELFFTEQGPDGLPARYYSPWTATLSPHGMTLLLVSDLGGVAGVLAAPLPPDGNLPYVSGHTETYTSAIATRASRARDVKVLTYNTLLTVIEE